jgi:DnaA-homolog protein
MKQIALPLAVDGATTFASFVPGANAMLLDLLQAFGPGSAPLYLWHSRQASGGRFGWFDATQPLPWPHDEGWSLLVLDDCDAFDATQQHAAFALFVAAASHTTLIAAAGRVPPVDLSLRDDLRSRLGWGHVMAVQALSDRDARDALRGEANARGLLLPDDVIDHLLHRHQRDLKHLMAQLVRLDEFSMVHKRAITLPLLRQMLAEPRAESDALPARPHATGELP